MNLTEVASQAIAADQAGIGDSWTFELMIDLPGVAVEDYKDLKVEIFGLDPTAGVFGFHMCQGKKFNIFLSSACYLCPFHELGRSRGIGLPSVTLE